MTDRIKQAALEVMARFGTADPLVICGDLGIIVLFVELPPHIRGFYSCFMGARIIYLNAGLEELRERRVVCAHELGHALLHASHNSLFLNEHTAFIPGRFEKEADLFAGYLLLDDEISRDCRCCGWTCEQVASQTGLSQWVVEHCLKENEH